jgi:hypothetical protein
MVIFGLLLNTLEAELGLMEASEDEADSDGLKKLFLLAALAASKLLRGLMPEVNLGRLASSGSEVRCFSGWDESRTGKAEVEGRISSS